MHGIIHAAMCNSRTAATILHLCGSDLKDRFVPCLFHGLITQPPQGEERDPDFIIIRLAPVLELTWRSLNALLERLHHSYFLYVPLSPDRFVTVEMYLVPAILLLLALALQVRGTHDVLNIQHTACNTACGRIRACPECLTGRSLSALAFFSH